MNATTTPDTIAQTSWTLIRWTSAQGQTRPVQPPTLQGRAANATGRQIKLDFLVRGDKYRVTGYSGCNPYQGRYALAHGELAITVPAAMRMTCPSPQAAALEHNFLNALATIKVFRLDNGGAPHAMILMLDGGDTLEFTRSEDPPTR
jgi:heat shock protein HslJ